MASDATPPRAVRAFVDRCLMLADGALQRRNAESSCNYLRLASAALKDADEKICGAQGGRPPANGKPIKQ